jgi:hypothetical protein
MDQAADEIERLRNGGACPHVRGTVTQHCSLNFTLTDAEREAVDTAIATLDAFRFPTLPAAADTLRRLLERLK